MRTEKTKSKTHKRRNKKHKEDLQLHDFGVPLVQRTIEAWYDDSRLAIAQHRHWQRQAILCVWVCVCAIVRVQILENVVEFAIDVMQIVVVSRSATSAMQLSVRCVRRVRPVRVLRLRGQQRCRPSFRIERPAIHARSQVDRSNCTIESGEQQRSPAQKLRITQKNKSHSIGGVLLFFGTVATESG